MVADARWRGVQLDQAVGGVPVDAPPAVRRHVGEERVAHQRMAEAVARIRPLDDFGAEARVQVGEGVLFGAARQGDELVGVEGGTDDRHSLQDRPRVRADSGDRFRAHGVRPDGLGRRPSRQLQHGERDPGAEGVDPIQHVRRRLPNVAPDQRGDVGRIERLEIDGDGGLAIEEATHHVVQRVVVELRPVGEEDAQPLLVAGAGEIVKEAQAGVVGVVHVVDP